MGAGSFLGGLAGGIATGMAIKGKTSKPDATPDPKPDIKGDGQPGPTDAEIAANQADLKNSGLADGGLVGKTHPRWYGKGPCK